jgi:hypothetical protein
MRLLAGNQATACHSRQPGIGIQVALLAFIGLNESVTSNEQFTTGERK